MNIQAIETDFRRTVGDSVRLTSDGVGRYRVFTPFLFEDGDHVAIVLKQEHRQWVLSDEGHTYMHNAGGDPRSHNGPQAIGDTLTAFAVEDRDGELRTLLPNEHPGAGLLRFVQAILKVAGGLDGPG